MLVGQERGGFALTDYLHYLECHARLKPLMYQVDHDAVTGAYDLRNGAGAVFDKLLRVAYPNIRAVRKARYL